MKGNPLATSFVVCNAPSSVQKPADADHADEMWVAIGTDVDEVTATLAATKCHLLVRNQIGLLDSSILVLSAA